MRTKSQRVDDQSIDGWTTRSTPTSLPRRRLSTMCVANRLRSRRRLTARCHPKYRNGLAGSDTSSSFPLQSIGGAHCFGGTPSRCLHDDLGHLLNRDVSASTRCQVSEPEGRNRAPTAPRILAAPPGWPAGHPRAAPQRGDHPFETVRPKARPSGAPACGAISGTDVPSRSSTAWCSGPRRHSAPARTRARGIPKIPRSECLCG